ncbi:hypothetical protein REPUB_Repub16aG0059600 [Reevesia pubescens]
MESLVQRGARQPENQVHRWCPPEKGYLKIDVNASYDANSKIAGLGMVIRDHVGRICCSAFTKKHLVNDPFLVEMLAILMGIEMAVELNFSYVVIKSDSLLAISEITK